MDLSKIILILLSFAPLTRTTCSNKAPLRVPKYNLMEKCHRSTVGVVFRANYTSLVSCQRLGIEKKGLALNFSPPEAIKDITAADEPVDYTCEVLKCAEADGGVSLVNDTRYDYYSLYAKNLPNINSTCIPGLGMFSLQLKMLNYSNAVAECKNMSGNLADIMSEKRTDALAQLLSGAGKEAAYVGVKSYNGLEFVSVTTGDTFECSTYRAWAPGHPKRQRRLHGCVTISSSRTWRTVPCETNMISICELEPSGPYKRPGRIFSSRLQNDTTPTTTPNDDSGGG